MCNNYICLDERAKMNLMAWNTLPNGTRKTVNKLVVDTMEIKNKALDKQNIEKKMFDVHTSSIDIRAHKYTHKSTK